MQRCVLLAVVLAFGMAHAAYAGTASVATINTSYKYQYTDPALVFRAAPGERNRIVVSRAAAGGTQASVLRDEGVPVSAGPGCTAIDERTVSCGAWHIDIDAGDGDDTVTLPSDGAGRAGYVRGGPGSDVLSGGGFLAGGPGDDVLTCPAGACHAGVLAGGGGDDLLRGGNGDDVLSGDGDGPPQMIVYDTVITESAGAGSDIIGGGLGRDQLTFRGRRASATIDLAAGRAGGAGGERDSLAGIENAAGGEGDDLLVGDARDNVLEGDAGDDRIDGRAGNDYLLGNLIPDTNEFGLGYTPPDPGADTLRGSAGDDRLDAGSERGDVLSGGAGDDTLQDELNSSAGTHARRVRCGSGRDTIDFAPRGQLVSDCELLRPT